MERNFEVLELGVWYVRRDGAIVQVGHHLTDETQLKNYFPYYAADQYYDESGRQYISIDTDKDLMTKIMPIFVMPCKKTRLVPCGIVLYSLCGDPTVTSGTWTEKEFRRSHDTEQFMRFVDLPEIPITMVPEEVDDE